MQCEVVLVRSVSDANGEQCRRSAIVTCELCGQEICGTHSDSCYECGLNFCNPCPSVNVTCLDDHAKATGHQVDLPMRKIFVSDELLARLTDRVDAVLAANAGEAHDPS